VIIQVRKLAAMLAGLCALLTRMAAGAQPASPPQATQAAAAAPAVESYVLGPEDIIEVSVLGRSDFTTRAKIAADGAIQLP
jgi:polysaccharide biosynthesis/export protein